MRCGKLVRSESRTEPEEVEGEDQCRSARQGKSIQSLGAY